MNTDKKNFLLLIIKMYEMYNIHVEYDYHFTNYFKLKIS